MDAFFAAVEQRDNPALNGKPVIIGADPKGGRGRGVVSTANYVARKYGIHSALPISKAYSFCPEAIFLPVDMELYQKTSDKIMKVVKSYSPSYEIVSVDEAYLDISFIGEYEKAEDLAKKLKKEIFDKEGLTGTVGIGPNKLVAKISSEKAKPDGLKIVRPEGVASFLDPLDIEDLPGIGEKTAEKMRPLGINKISDLKKLSEADLKIKFGKVGQYFYERARGIDNNPITSENIIKSIGKEHTFETDTRDSQVIFKIFDGLIRNVNDELSLNNFSFKTITVVCRFSGFETHTKSKTLKEPVKKIEILEKEAKNLLLRFMLENLKPIRLVGVRASSFIF